MTDESHSPPGTAFDAAKSLSPRRNSTAARTIPELVTEQLEHFGIDAETEFGQALARIATRLYEAQADVDVLWRHTLADIARLDRRDRIAYFNAKKFLSFQLAKILDTLQNPFRKDYQSLQFDQSTLSAKGAYPIFDNVTAIFSATPVITRTATYIFACAEWIEDAFKGKELLLEIYSRLLNPTSLSLANHIVDLEAGPYAGEYLAWNYNSGMAAIDAVLSHVLGQDDVILISRNIYGGAHQLLYDWYAKPSNLNIAVLPFDGETVDDFLQCWDQAQRLFAHRCATRRPDDFRKTYVYLESPSNPHGYVLDVPGICKAAHDNGLRVILDATVGTPFLIRPLQRRDPAERPDFVIHSYTKDLTGTGSVIAGTVIARNEDMFAPKGSDGWERTMFWNVYYVKGAFLNPDTAYEVLQGMRTLEMRMLSKCINTLILTRFLHHHPQITVNANCIPGNVNAPLRERLLFLGLPAPLFTIDMPQVPLPAFQRFFDALEPAFGHMISLGQTNTIVSCPGLTTHSELNEKQLHEAGITRTTIRFAVGNENPKDLIRHFIDAASLTIDPVIDNFSKWFMDEEETRQLIVSTYTDVHRRYIEAQLQPPAAGHPASS